MIERGKPSEEEGGDPSAPSQAGPAAASLLHAVFIGSRDAIGVSRAGVHVVVNPSYLALFGFPADADLAGMPVLDLIAPGSREEVRELIARRQRGEPVPAVYETRGRRVDGTEFDMEASVALHGDGGEALTVAILRDVTGRLAAEREVAERGAMLRQILDTADVAIFLVDRTGRITHANRRMTEMFGCDIDDILGSEYVSLVHPSERAIGRRKMLALLASEIEGVDLERRYWRQDGTEFWGHLAGRRFQDVGGRELGLIGVITDIDQRRRAEEELRRSEEKYRRLYNETPVMMHSIDAGGILISVSDQWLRILGYAREEVLGRPSVDFLDEESSAYARQVALPEFMRTGSCTDIPCTFVRKDGERISTLLSATAERDEAGNVVRSLAVIIDVTERKRAEAALRESEERYRQLFEAESDAIFLIDNESGRILMANEAAEALYDCPREELLALRNTDLSAEPSETRRVTEESPVVRQNTVTIPLRYHRKRDGTVFPVEITGRFFTYRDRPVHIAAIRDITERKRLEQELLRAQKLESLGTLAGGIAHDFNNLLQGVFGYISIAMANLDDRAKARSLLELAERALHRSVSLSSQLLTFSKGGLPVKTVLALGPVIEAAVSFALSGSHAGSELSLEEGLSTVDADAGQLSQVLHNLLLNAVQASQEGGKIEVSANNVPAAAAPTLAGGWRGDSVAIRVADNGRGIPREHLSRIFDPYFTTKEKGSGLGLATVYSIVRNHGGTITVTSEPGKGSAFTLYLPAAGAPAEEPAPPSAPADGRRGRVLVMDDEPVVREVAGEILRALGHEVALAEHGAEAVARYSEARSAGRPFDVVILDLTIRGGVGGVEAMRSLLEIDPGVKVVVSSGYCDDPSLAEYRELGFKAFLQKPYDMRQLRELLAPLI